MTSTESTVRAMLIELLEEDGVPVPEIGPDTVLLDTGLDSLGLAVLVTRLESSLGYDPFSIMTEATYPRTMAEFVAIYDKYAPAA